MSPFKAQSWECKLIRWIQDKSIHYINVIRIIVCGWILQTLKSHKIHGVKKSY